jgi:hypothetical protein
VTNPPVDIRDMHVIRPALLSWLESAELIGLRVGRGRVDLTFTRTGHVTAVQVSRKEGYLDVLVRQ